MQRIQLLGGSYTTRSIIGYISRCVNLFPEVNPANALTQVTYYQSPAVVTVQTCPAPAAGRGIWRASNGACFCVVGSNFYHYTSGGFSLLGTLTTSGPGMCSFVDNGTTGLVVDGTGDALQVTLATFITSPYNLTVSGGLFQGADRVDYSDTFIVWNTPGTNQFCSTLSNTLDCDPLYTAGKSGWPDPIMSVIFNRHELVLLGALKSEMWYDAGNATFPFAELPGPYFEHGTCAKYSVASADTNIFFLGQDLQGQGVVFVIQNYTANRISNHALEYAIRQINKSVGISDAVGWTFQQDGHTFYVLTFPAGDVTWVYDMSTQEWFQWAWSDGTQLHRCRAQGFALIENQMLTQDWETGAVCLIDPLSYKDQVGSASYDIPRIRSFPHLGAGSFSMGAPGLNRPTMSDGNRVSYGGFALDIEVGNCPVGDTPTVLLRYSDDRGKTWTGEVLQSLGASGQYLTQPKWAGLGQARDRIFEIEYSVNGEAALNGAWVMAKVELT